MRIQATAVESMPPISATRILGTTHYSATRNAEHFPTTTHAHTRTHTLSHTRTLCQYWPKKMLQNAKRAAKQSQPTNTTAYKDCNTLQHTRTHSKSHAHVPTQSRSIRCRRTATHTQQPDDIQQPERRVKIATRITSFGKHTTMPRSVEGGVATTAPAA